MRENIVERLTYVRGKCRNGDWVFGQLRVWSDGLHTIHSYADADCPHEVIPETIGMYLGMMGLMPLFTGDIVEGAIDDEYYKAPITPIRGVVEFVGYNIALCGVQDGAVGGALATLQQVRHAHIIGTIHDNPELMESSNV